MPEVCRVSADKHIGHASGTRNPFHSTSYATGSGDVFTESQKTVRGQGTDTTACGDLAVGASSTVFVNSKGVHRKGDGTGGHGSWVPNKAASGSTTVIAGG